MKLCPHCRQPLPEWRAGVRLSPLKAHIFDVIKRADSNGITIEDINRIASTAGRPPSTSGITFTKSTTRWLKPTLRFSGMTSGMRGFFHIRQTPLEDRRMMRLPGRDRIPTPANLRAAARRADRRVANVDRVLAAMKRGEFLHLQYENGRPLWSLSGGWTVPANIAALVIADVSVVAVGRALFDDCLGQAWRIL